MVLDIDKVCRLCLELSSNSIFYPSNSSGHQTTLNDDLVARIFECTSLKVSTGEGLPQSVCEACVRLIDKFVLFRKMCWDVDSKLRQYFFSEKSGSFSSVLNPVRLDSDQLNLPLEAKDGWMCETQQIKGEQETSDDEEGNGDDFDNDESDNDYTPRGSKSSLKSSKQKYNCDMCNETFKKSSELKNHKEEDHAKGKKSKPVMTCHHCNKSFKQLKRFKDHMKTHEESDGEKEDTEGMISHNNQENSSDSDFHSHDVDMKNNEIEARKNQQPKDSGGGSTGIRKRKFRKVYECEYCDQVFHSHAKYTQHELTHTGEKKYNCSDCPRSFTHKHSLIGHIKEQHTGEVNFTCDVCGRGFVHQSTFNIHKKTHSTEKPLKCPDCDKCFTQMKNLRVHQQIHSASRSHTCQVCGKSFNFMKTLKVHLVLHSGEKPYVCTYCGKAFAQSAPLKTHTRIHTGEKPYQCTICPLRFSTNNARKSHILKHSGEAPYCCKVCNKGFSRKKDMVAHQEEMHGVYIGLPSQSATQMLSQTNMQDNSLSQNCMSPSPLQSLPSMIIVPEIIEQVPEHLLSHAHTHHSPPPLTSIAPSHLSHIIPHHHHNHLSHHPPTQLHSLSHQPSSSHLPPQNCIPHPSAQFNPQLHRTDLPGTDCSGG